MTEKKVTPEQVLCQTQNKVDSRQTPHQEPKRAQGLNDLSRRYGLTHGTTWSSKHHQEQSLNTVGHEHHTKNNLYETTPKKAQSTTDTPLG